MHNPKNILVTGGAGFIGSNFIRLALTHFPHAIIYNLDLLTYAGSPENLENLPDLSRYKFIHGDICDQPLVEKILQDYAIDTIVHFAAESHVDRSIAGPAPFIQTNIVGTFILLEAAKKIWLNEKKWNAANCRFHHVSTDEVYGTLKKEDPAFTETTPLAPNSPYSASKASSDHLVHAYYHTYGLPITMSHCSNNYGPYQHAEKFIPTVIHSCLTSQPIPIYGDGSNIRDWLYVEDHCRGIFTILEKGVIGKKYNIGGNCEMSNLEVAKHICQEMDILQPKTVPHESLMAFVPDRLGHDWRYAMDTRLIQRELGFTPQENFSSGIRKTIKFYANIRPISRHKNNQEVVDEGN